MVEAILLIMADSGTERQIYEDLNEIDGVEDVDIVYGVYDLTARIKIADTEGLGKFIMLNIRSLKGVKNTSTLIVVE